MFPGAKIRISEENSKFYLRIFEPMEQREPSSLLEWPSRERGRRCQREYLRAKLKDSAKRGKFQIFFLLLHSEMKEVADTTTNYLSPGSICWAAFLAMGARLENSPNILADI